MAKVVTGIPNSIIGPGSPEFPELEHIFNLSDWHLLYNFKSSPLSSNFCLSFSAAYEVPLATRAFNKMSLKALSRNGATTAGTGIFKLKFESNVQL